MLGLNTPINNTAYNQLQPYERFKSMVFDKWCTGQVTAGSHFDGQFLKKDCFWAKIWINMVWEIGQDCEHLQAL